MPAATCHCKAVRIAVEAQPSDLNACQCSICRRYGVQWAYYDRATVQISGDTDFYSWGDRELEFHRCRGCVTHYVSVDATTARMAVNGRMFEPADIAGVPVRESPGPD